MARPFLFFREYGFTILFVVVFFLAFIWMGTKRTLQSSSNNVEDWLPANIQETKDYKWFLQNFPMESFVVISWNGCKVADESGEPSEPNDEGRIEMFAQKLVPSQTIDNMGSWFNAKEVIADLDVSQVKNRQNSDGTEELEQKEVDRAETIETLANIAASVKTDQKSEKTYFKTVLTYPRLKKLLMDNSQGILDEEAIQARLSGTLIGPDGSSTALMAFLTRQPKGKEANLVLDQVRNVARELGIEPPLQPDNRWLHQKAVDNFKEMIREMVYGREVNLDGLIMGGPPVDNAAIGAEGERTVFRLAGFCAFIGIGIAYLCFLSFRLTLFVFWTSILSAGISLAVVSLTGQRSDAIMLSMPALIYIMAMSGSIHLINYYHDAIRESGLKGAPERAIKLGWFPCMIAALTTAFGLISLYASNLTPIKKFGLFSALGVLGTLVLIFLFLPALLYFYPSRDYDKKFGGKGLYNEETNSYILKFWHFMGAKIIRYNNWVAISLCAAMILFAFGLPMIKPSVKMMKFYSQDAPIIQNYRWLENHLGPLVPMEVVLRFDNKTCPLSTIQRLRVVDHVAEELRSDTVPEIGGVISAATMVPIDSDPSTLSNFSSMRRGEEYATSSVLDSNRPTLKDYIATELRTKDGKIPTVEELGISEKEVAWLHANKIDTLTALIQIPEGESFHGISAEKIKPYRDAAVAWQKEHGIDLWRISVRVWALQKSDIDYFLLINSVKDVVNKMITSDQLKAIADPLQDGINQEKFADVEVAGVDAVYTGMVPLVYQTQHKLIEGLIHSLILAFVSIAAVFCLILKSPTAGFIAMVPNVFPVIIVFGFMGLNGTLVDVGTMMTASVALGVAVDNTMHYLTWFREAVDRGMKPKEAALEGYERCATAMTETTLIGGLGLSAFMFSTFTPTQMFGIMMLAILGVSIIGDLIFLPAILTGPFGRFFLKISKKKDVKWVEDFDETLKNAPGYQLGDSRISLSQGDSGENSVAEHQTFRDQTQVSPDDVDLQKQQFQENPSHGNRVHRPSILAERESTSSKSS